ncbi:hypothetical protein FRC05_007782 [Tulasnella sp. 425]|nr:hypothetical protein FRC05_007782 [Tulasnella sp. 425]
MLVLLLSLAIYFLADKLEPLSFLAHKLGETLGALNDLLKVLVTYLDGIRTTIGSALSHLSDVWCMFVSGPSCDAQHHSDGPEPGGDLRKAPLASTKEMLNALRHLSELDTDIDFPKRIRSFTAKILRSKLSDHLQEEIKLERKEAFDNWNSMVLSKDFAVSQATAMAQHLIHQYFAIDRELRRPISWSAAVLSLSKWRRDDLRADIMRMAKDTALHVQESRGLLNMCTGSSKDVKERVSRLQELSESWKETLDEAKKQVGFFCWRNCDPYGIDAHLKEWDDIGVHLGSAYDTAVVAEKKCSKLGVLMGNWMTNFNSTRGLTYDAEIKSFIGPHRDPREILDAVEGTILLLLDWASESG